MDNSKRLLILRRRSRRSKRGGVRIFIRVLAGVLLLLLFVSTTLLLSGAGTVAGVYAYFAKDLPDPEKIEEAQEDFETTKIFDRTGQHLLYEIFDQRPNRGDRTYVTLDQMPLHVRQAVIALEDRSFYENPGINFRGLARAFVNNLLGQQVQGGSSITQQLIKQVLIDPEERYVQSYGRKIKETILALEITRRYPGKEGKDQILEWYLNYNYYGNFSYGVEAAAQVYFGKSIREVDLAEAAMLTAIPQFPAMNPIDNPDQAKRRQQLVLNEMVRAGFISQEEADTAFAQELVTRYSLQARFEDMQAPHFAIYVHKALEEEFGPDRVYGGGLRIYTTLDLELQNKVEEIAREHIKTLQEDQTVDRNATNASVVVMRPRTGEILAMLGSLNYHDESIDGQVNIALADRQPGSAFKPFTYLTLFSQGYTAAQMVMDVRTAFPDPPNPAAYVPENYDRKYRGPVRLRNALASSYNIPAVWALSKAGVKNVLDTAHRMGINTLTGDFYGLSLTLGGGEVRLIDMTYAYAVFSTNGVMAGQEVPAERRRPGFRELDPVSILRVEDRYGNVLKTYDHPETRQILPPELAYLMTDILADNRARVPGFGANNKLQLDDRPAGVKTGTTNAWKDAWAIGYTPQYVTGVWVGNANNDSMDRVPGSLGAAPIWQAVMHYLHESEPVENFVRPPGLEEKEVCAVSGMLPTEYCPNRVRELFFQGTAPTVYCNVHQVFRINRETEKLATVYTPAELVEERVYEIYPPEADDWVRNNSIPQPPRVYDDAYGPGPASGDVAIIEPSPYAYISGGVVIVGNARPHDFRMWRLEYGQGLNPKAWSQIGGDRYDGIDQGPMEYWDVTGLDGLYTLQLRVVKNDGSIQDAAIQVTVDNTPPDIALVYPLDGAVYEEEKEWVNIQANATDNAYMDRVEFYMNGELFSTSSVPPFNEKWTITLSNTIPTAGLKITRTEPVYDEAGNVIGEQVVTDTEVISEKLADGRTRLTQWFANGRGIIYDSAGYTETHIFHAIAYDAAGNTSESEKVRIYVTPKRRAQQEGNAGATAPAEWNLQSLLPERHRLTEWPIQGWAVEPEQPFPYPNPYASPG